MRRLLFGLLACAALLHSASLQAANFLEHWQQQGGTAIRPDGTVLPKPEEPVPPPPKPLSRPTTVLPTAIKRLEAPDQLTTTTWYVDVQGQLIGYQQGDSVTIQSDPVEVSPNGQFKARKYVPLGRTDLEIVAASGSNKLTKYVRIERITKRTATQSLPRLNPLKLKGRPNPNGVAIIVGIESYAHLPAADFAEQDARVFYDYAHHALGIAPERIQLLTGSKATRIELLRAVNIWLKGVTAPGQSDVYLFFAGHGLASTDGKSAYVLPYDADPDLLDASAIERGRLLQSIARLSPRSVVVMLDACYTGVSRTGEALLAGARSVIIAPRWLPLPQDMTVLTATSGNEIAFGIGDVRHGAFSYFLMRGLQGEADTNNDHQLTASELDHFGRLEIGRNSNILPRSQTPEILGQGDAVLTRW